MCGMEVLKELISLSVLSFGVVFDVVILFFLIFVLISKRKRE